MSKLKSLGLVSAAAAGLTKQDWLFILSILLTVLGMVHDYVRDKKMFQKYLRDRKNGR